MTNSKTTKRALFSSVVALLLCFTMLLGTTFAWFIDSAASGSNVITAGNLDIVVEYTLDGTNWNNLDGATDLFQKGLWEPGHTEVVALRIKNNGTLALKYNANMNIVSEKPGTNKEGNEFKLSEILTVSTGIYGVTDEVDPFLGYNISEKTLELAFADESSVVLQNTATFAQGSVLGSDKKLMPEETHYLIVRVDMAESVGNEANHMGKGFEPSINFGINVLATQFTYENDSFGNQYDKEAEDLVIVNSFKDMMKVCQTGGTMILGSDLVYTTEDAEAFGGRDIFTIENKSVTLDMNGHSITVAEDASNLDGALFFVSGSEGHISIVGNGAITVENGQAVVVWVKTGATADVYGGTFTSNAAAHEAMFYSQGNGGVINIYGGQYIYNLSGTINGGFNVSDNAGTELRIVLHEGVLLNHAEYSQHLQGTTNGEQERIQLAEGCSIQEVVIDGNTWYKVVCD